MIRDLLTLGSLASMPAILFTAMLARGVPVERALVPVTMVSIVCCGFILGYADLRSNQA